MARDGTWPKLSLRSGCTTLATALALAYAVVAAIAWLGFGLDALRIVAGCSLVCGVSAMVALLLTALTTATPNAGAGTLGAMAVGMGAPIAAAAIFGFSGWLVVCFEIALLFETLVAVSVVARYRTPVVGRASQSS